MRKAAILITGILAALGIFAAVYAGHSCYREARFKSYLKAVGLPTETGYMGGDYPKWEPMEFTYKKNKETNLDGLRDESYFTTLAYSCSPLVFKYSVLTPYEELKKLAETDPDAMYMMYYKALSAEDEESAVEYLRKAMALGHISATVDYTGIYTSWDNDSAETLAEYAEITPRATVAIIINEFKLKLNDNKKVTSLLPYTGGYPYLAETIFYLFDDTGTDITRIPNYKDYICETYYRGCFSMIPMKDKYNIKCSQ